MSSYYRNFVDFALAFLRRCLKDGEEVNYSASTTSIYLALAMIHLGAKNESSRELTALLGADFSSIMAPGTPKNELFVSIKEITHELCQSGEIENIMFTAIPLREDYKKVLVELFCANFEDMSFENPSIVVKAVNKWVNEHTHGRITDLIDESAITPETVSILINTIYFKGIWKKAFDATLTKSAPFYLKSDVIINVSFMAQKGRFKIYNSEDRFQALSMEFQQGNSLGVFLLPTQRKNIKEFLQCFQSENLKEILQQSVELEVNVRIPKFKIDTNTKVKEILEYLGVKAIFDRNQAELTFMSDSPLWVEDIIHRSTVEIDEKGAVAAAASAVMFAGRSLNVDQWFVADRPFIFIIVDRITRIPMFMNIIYDPSKS